MQKLIVVHNIIAPYRVSLFTKIAAQKDIDCEVIFCSETEAMREWSIPDRIDFKHRILGGSCVSGFSGIAGIAPQLFIHLIRSDPDVIVTGEFSVPTISVMLYCMFYNKRYIVWSDATKHSEARICNIKRLLRMLLLRRSSACIASGKEACEYLISLGAFAGKIRQSILTLDVDKFSHDCATLSPDKKKLKKKYGLSGRVILFSGQLIHRKGVIYLLEACRILQPSLKDMSILILGNGELKRQLVEYCRTNRLRVKFTGFIQQKKIPMYYAMADIFVLPSLCDPWGIVVNEAIAAGLPVVCSKYAGAAADLVVDGQNGYVVDPRDVYTLANRIRSILLSDRVLGHMRQKSEQMMKRCTLEVACRGFLSAVDYVLSHQD